MRAQSIERPLQDEAATARLGEDLALRAAMRADPALLKSSTEEFLRVYPPARTHARTVTRDTEFGGCPMAAGDRVVLSEISANHDELAFDDPHTFRADRFPNRHVSFGMGKHRCPGSHLARMEFSEMMRGVLQRMPDYRFTGDGPVEYPPPCPSERSIYLKDPSGNFLELVCPRNPVGCASC